MSEVRTRIGGQIVTSHPEKNGRDRGRPLHHLPELCVVFLVFGWRLTVFGSLSSCAKSQDHLSNIVISPPFVISNAVRNLLFSMSEVRCLKSEPG